MPDWRAYFEQADRELQAALVENQRLREALISAQGEAYLGMLDGDDTPSPLAACEAVITTCLNALGDA